METIECLRSILNEEFCSLFDILIIDNEQKNPEVESEHYAKLGGNIKYIANIENKGFSAAANQGAMWAKDNGYQKIIFANNDTRVTPDAVNNLIRACDNESNEKIVGYLPIICYYDRPDKVWNAGGEISLFGFRKCINSDKNLDEVSTFGDIYTYATGCFILFRLKSFIDEGLYSENFFFGEEDFNLSYRLLRKKYKYRLVKKSIVYHKVSKTILKDKAKELNSICLYYTNRFIDIRKLIGSTYLCFLCVVYIPYIYFIILKGRLEFWDRFKFISGVISNSMRLDGVPRELFQEIMSKNYLK